MARVIIECNDCGARYDVTRRKPRSKVRCKSCSAILKIPGKDKIVAKRQRAVPEGESDRALRVKKAKERGQIDHNYEEELQPGEEIEGLVKPDRLEALSVLETLKQFSLLFLLTFSRYVLVAVTTLVIAVFATIVVAFVIRIVFGEDQNDQQIFAGSSAIMSALTVLIAEGAGIIFGRKVLTDLDSGLNLEKHFRAVFRDAWDSSKAATKMLLPLLLADGPFYVGVLILTTASYVALDLPGIGALLGSLVILVFIPGFVLLGVHSRLTKVGVIVEKRSLIFSVKRAWLLMSDIETLKYIFVLSIVQGLIFLVIMTVFQMMAYILVFLFVGSQPLAVNDVAGAVSLLFMLTLNGLFFATVHFNLTKDEGLG